MTVVTRAALVKAARNVLDTYPTGITPEQAVIIAFSRLQDEPLDPHDPDDAAVILRSEYLLVEGFKVAKATATAHQELTHTRHRHTDPPAQGSSGHASGTSETGSA